MDVEKVLEIVKDSDKFAKRIKELAKAEADCTASAEKATAKNKATFAEYDAKVAEYEAKLADLKAKAAGVEKSLEPMQKAIIEGEAFNAKVKKTLEKATEQFEKEKDTFFKTLEDSREKRDEYVARARAFQSAVKAAFENL
ncbi:hypothetical protein N9878_00490 [bacterium]|nr:hypothetical protein [bacterium]